MYSRRRPDSPRKSTRYRCSPQAPPYLVFSIFALFVCGMVLLSRPRGPAPPVFGPKFKNANQPSPNVPDSRPRVLVTGGAGYIGSHTVVELVAAGFAVTIVDSLVNSSPESVARVRNLVRAPDDAIAFVVGDVRDEAVLTRILSRERHEAIIHFAALKAVGESIEKPLEYYENNLGGLTNVLVRQ